MRINEKEVVDAKRPLSITVSKEDCARGKTKDPAACAAARAIMRELEGDGVLSARVHRGVTYIEYPKKWVRYITPTSLKTELTVFDRGANFEPSAHQLSVPQAQSLENLREKYAENAKTDSRARHDQNKAKRKRHEIPNIRPRGANR